MKKTVLALSLMMGICSASSAFAALPQSIRIGTDATYAPFSSKDAKGDFVGFDIDLGNELCSRIKVKCTWEPFYFAIVCGLIYLVFTTASNGVLLMLERRYSVGVKRADL